MRIVSATNADLPRAIAAGQFREDLYFRLNVIELHVPPLGERPDDMLPLAEHFLARSPPRRTSAGRALRRRGARRRCRPRLAGQRARAAEPHPARRADSSSDGRDRTGGDLGIPPARRARGPSAEPRRRWRADAGRRRCRRWRCAAGRPPMPRRARRSRARRASRRRWCARAAWSPRRPPRWACRARRSTAAWSGWASSWSAGQNESDVESSSSPRSRLRDTLRRLGRRLLATLVGVARRVRRMLPGRLVGADRLRSAVAMRCRRCWCSRSTAPRPRGSSGDGVVAVSDGLLEPHRGRLRRAPGGAERRRGWASWCAASTRWPRCCARERSGVYQREMLLETVLAASTTMAVITATRRCGSSTPTRAAREFFGGGRKLEGQTLARPARPRAPDRACARRRRARDATSCSPASGRSADEPETFHLASATSSSACSAHILFMLQAADQGAAAQGGRDLEEGDPRDQPRGQQLAGADHVADPLGAPDARRTRRARAAPRRGAGHDRGARDAPARRSSTATRSFARLPAADEARVPWHELLDGRRGRSTRSTVEGELPDAPGVARRRPDAAGADQPAQERRRVGQRRPTTITLAVAEAARRRRAHASRDRGKGMARRGA